MKNDPASLARIGDLTRRYARYSRSQAGLSAAWAGLCVAFLGAFVAAYDLIRYGDRWSREHPLGFREFLAAEESQTQPPLLVLIAFGLPVLWLIGRSWIQRRVYERDGVVIERSNPAHAVVRHLFTVAEAVLAFGLISLQWSRLDSLGFPAALLLRTILSSLVLILLPFIGRRMVSVHDRSALLLLFVGSAAVLAAGFAEALLVMMLAYIVLGAVLAVLGLWTHGKFCRVRRDLAALALELPAAERPVEPRTFTPRFLPRNGRDWALSLSVGLLPALIVLLPLLGLRLLTHSWETAANLLFFPCAILPLFLVEKLTVGPDGIRFHRIFGNPKFLPWERVVSVQEVGARELIVQGWLWPVFPARESSASFSTLGHYRISWDGGHCYFPPANAEQFEATVAGMRGGATDLAASETSSNPLRR